jgi:HSP20 family molecular chaperone IbpA
MSFGSSAAPSAAEGVDRYKAQPSSKNGVLTLSLRKPRGKASASGSNLLA